MSKLQNTYENKIHGRIDFPYIIYSGRLPEFLRYFPLHWHDEFELIWIKSGKGYFRVLSQEFLCETDDIIIIPPGAIHSIRQMDDEVCIYYNILFKFSLLEQDEKSFTYQKYFKPFMEAANFISCARSGKPLNKSLLPDIKFLIDNRREHLENKELIIKSRLFMIMSNLQSALISSSSENEAKMLGLERLKPILQYVSDNYGTDISIEDAAEMASMSPTYFMKFFKKRLGITFVNYLNQVRLENAQLFLKTSDMNISEICEKCGFHNFSYFIRTFKSALGCTPKDFRKRKE